MTSALLLSLIVWTIATVLPEERGTLRGRITQEKVTRNPREKVDAASTTGEDLNSGQTAREGMEDVIVWLLPDGKPVPAPPSRRNDASEAARLRIKDGRWSPRVLVFPEGETLIVDNQDNQGHDGFPDVFVNNDLLQVQEYTVIHDRPVPPAKTIVFPRHSTTQIRNIPAWPFPVQYFSSSPNDEPHKAVMFSAPTPYWAVTNERGEFVIKHLPAGRWKFVAWHESVGYLRHVEHEGRRIVWRRGVFEREIGLSATHVDSCGRG